jgi:hypothetical protein
MSLSCVRESWARRFFIEDMYSIGKGQTWGCYFPNWRTSKRDHVILLTFGAGSGYGGSTLHRVLYFGGADICPPHALCETAISILCEDSA